ncbi:VOC family protein [Neptunicella marina]|uniref:VOC family protein n=1 Tax=Neptunicella marina TaxID=2125989 RepID=A0A8J6ITE7_9ALTE|nr:VOC family protein [Neptunicella marina]MBC3765557.1 VOC family protein [Neptunicella marina]
MSLSLHIDFNGNCQQAFEFYAANLQGKIGTMLQVKDSPLAQQESSEWQDKIVHANINIHNIELAGADVKPKQYHKPRGFYLLLGLTSESAVKDIYNKLAEHGEVILPPQKTFWSPCYAIVTDRFAVPWKLNCS